MGRDSLTQEALKGALNYEPLTGLFYWREKRGPSRPAGSLAGWARKDGYVVIYVAGFSYLAHRLAWLYVHGQFPQGVIDHINGNPNDNRLCNLRDVDQAANCANRHRPNSNNPLGHLGVQRNRNSYLASLMVRGTKVLNKTFPTLEQAVAARAEAKAQYG